jgi:hypothetical protein
MEQDKEWSHKDHPDFDVDKFHKYTDELADKHEKSKHRRVYGIR